MLAAVWPTVGADMDECTIDVTKVLVWLSRVGNDEARTLIGCLLDDGESDDVIAITALDETRRVITLSTGRRRALRTLLNGAIIDARPGTPLRAAIAGATTPADRRADAVGQALRQAGIDPSKLGSDAARGAVLKMLQLRNTDALPGEDVRHGFYISIRESQDSGLARIAASIVAQLMSRYERAGAGVPEDLHWRYTALLRQGREWHRAVEVSEVLYQGRIERHDHRRLLATTRAAVLLDLVEYSGERRWLPEARRAADMAWALGPGDQEVHRVYDRLKRCAS